MIAIAWIIFGAVILGLLLFSFGVVRYYQDKRESELLPTIVTVLGLTLTLLCVFLIPVDIYNASSSANSKGDPLLTHEQIIARGNTLRTIYYILYGLVLGFSFAVIPFAYFYYEEHDENVTIGQKIWAGCKYTIFLIVIIAILLVVGLVIFLVKKPSKEQSTKAWVQSLIDKENLPEATVSFMISSLTLLGYLIWLTYTAYGLSIFPISTIRGTKHVVEESSQIRTDIEKNKKQQKDINSKYLSGSKKVSKRDEAKIGLLKRKERSLGKQHDRLQGTQTWYRHIWTLIRPFMFLFGFIFILVSLLIIVSIVLTNADKAINQIHFCGSQCGFITAYPKIFNPLDSLLTILSKFFPVDYVILALLIFYIFFSTLSGIVHIGVRFLWVHLFEVRRSRTPPQGLLFSAIILMLSLLALNMQITTLAPQYATFGSQVFYNTTVNATQPCNLDALANTTCTMTQIGTIINRINIRTSFFGVIFYYISWAFVLAFIIGSIVACIKSRRSNIERHESDSDEDES